MTLNIAVGYGNTIIIAKERAIAFYETVEGKKVFRAVESQQGYDSANNQAFVTTIWFEIVPPVVEQPQGPKYEFIGSTDIDPADPDWYAKWKALQGEVNDQAILDQETADADWRTNTDDFSETAETMAHIADH